MSDVDEEGAGGLIRVRRLIDHPNFVCWWYAGNVILLTVTLLVPVWLTTALHRYHNYDLGIFAQALASIRPGNLNPFLPAINLRLFNDHFDPILLLVAPLTTVLEPAYAALLAEHVLVLLSPLPLVVMFRRSEYSPLLAVAITYLLFNRGMLSALSYPVHPTTWAAFFMVLAGAILLRGRLVWLPATAVLLMACKEEFPFVVLVLGLGVLVQGRRRWGSALAILALAWIAGVFLLRPALLGPTQEYASRILKPMVEAPLTTLLNRLTTLGEAKRFGQTLFPLVPLLYALWRGRIAPNWIFLAAGLPLLAIRLIAGAWNFHYLAPVAPLLLLALFRGHGTPLRWRHASLCILAVFVAGVGPLAKGLRTYVHVAELRGPRMAAVNGARMHLLEHSEGAALVQGNLTPLLARRGQVYQIGGVQPDREYRFVMAEMPPGGDPWPLTHAQIARRVAGWRQDPRVTVLVDDEYVFLAEFSR